MKNLKKHPINDKAQNLSKDMKKQGHVKPKSAKKIDADDSLSDPKITKKYSKPSNRKLDGENFLSKDAGKIKKFNELLDPMGGRNQEEKTSTEETNDSPIQNEENEGKVFIAELHQNGEGCDYTIACGVDVIQLSSTNMEDAVDELNSLIEEEYTDDRSLSKATIYEVVNKRDVI